MTTLNLHLATVVAALTTAACLAITATSHAATARVQPDTERVGGGYVNHAAQLQASAALARGEAEHAAAPGAKHAYVDMARVRTARPLDTALVGDKTSGIGAQKTRNGSR